MNAAQQLFLQQGVARTTIEQITSTADVAKGTFYLYFSSKDDVLAGLGDRYGQERLAKVQAAVAQKLADDWKYRHFHHRRFHFRQPEIGWSCGADRNHYQDGALLLP